MVTIEQKLTLFSKLLNQDIKAEMTEKFDQLDKEYEKRIAESKFQVDKEASKIVEEARKRAEIKKVELISKGKLSSKKEMMQAKEEMIKRFMKSLEEKTVEFTQTLEYAKYFKQMIKRLGDFKEDEDELIVYLSQRDYGQNQAWIKEEFLKQGIGQEKLKFDVAQTNILGGCIVVNPKMNTRIDLSIRATLDEARDQIIEKISRAIEEVGEDDE